MLAPGPHADWAVVLKFGLPAILAAYGARLLLYLSDLQPLLHYQVFGREAYVMPVKLVVAILMVVFAWFELAPRRAPLALTPRYLPLGGVMSGFLGSLGPPGCASQRLSHQGGVDQGKLHRHRGGDLPDGGYPPDRHVWGQFPGLHLMDNRVLIGAAVLGAFSGAWLGNQLLTKVTLRLVQIIVALMLLAIAAALGSGLI